MDLDIALACRRQRPCLEYCLWLVGVIVWPRGITGSMPIAVAGIVGWSNL